MTPIPEAQAPTRLREEAIEALAAESIRFTNPGITDEEIYTLEHAGTLVIERRRELCARQLDAITPLIDAAIAEAVGRRDDLIERFDDAITDMFEQMLKGKWVDDHGHDVRLNRQMAALRPLILDAIKLRARGEPAP